MVLFSTLEDVEAAMRAVVQRAFLTAPFLSDLRAGRYFPAQLRHFAVQYSFYSRRFPLVLGAAIAAMEPQAEWWMPLADNLWDEAGRGVPGWEHEALYRTFLLSVAPDLELDARGMPPAPVSPAVEKAVSAFLDFFRTAPPLDAMAAVGLGSEFFAGDVMGAIAQGLRHPAYHSARPLDLRFWDMHAREHEPRHYALCRRILARHSSADELARQYSAGARIAASEALMYQELHGEMQAIR